MLREVQGEITHFVTSEQGRPLHITETEKSQSPQQHETLRYMLEAGGKPVV